MSTPSRPKRRRSSTCCSACLQVSPPRLAHLSDELLLIVFSHLGVERLLSVVPLVCRRWRRLHADPGLYRSLVLDGRRLDTDTAVRLVRMAPWLHSLQLINRWDADRILAHVGESNPRLRTLTVHNCKGARGRWHVSAQHLRSVALGCPLLRRLSLRRTFTGSLHFFSCVGLSAQPLRRATHFDPLMLASPALLHVRAEANGGQTEAKRVYPASGPLTDQAVATFCRKYASRLTLVKIHCEACTDASFRSLSRCRHLSQLHLYMHRCSRVTPRGLSHVGDMPALTELCVFSSETVTAPAWAALFRQPFCRRLRTLCLVMCRRVDDQVCRVIAENAAEMRALAVVCCVSVTDQGHLALMRGAPQRCVVDFKIYSGKYWRNYFF